MFMAFPRVWCPMAPDLAGSSLIAPATPGAGGAAFPFLRSSSGWRIRRLPHSSPRGSPPPIEPTDENSGQPPPSAAAWRRPRTAAPIFRSDVAGFLHESRKPGLVEGSLKPALTRKSFRGRPLWKRILFASTKVRGIILLNVVTIVYASNIPVVKEVEVIMDPATFNVVRFALSAIPFLPFILQARGDDKTRSSGIELGFWVSLGYLSQALGLLTSDAGRASFLSAFTVIVVPLIDGMFGATVPLLTWFGAFISLIGVAMLECGGSPPCVGDVLNLLSAFFFGIHMLRTEQISRNTKREKFLALLGYEICMVALFSAVWFLFRDIFGGSDQMSFGSWTWTNLWDWMISFPWVPALYTGAFSTGFCLWIEMDAMRKVSATETAIIYGLEPVWGAAFALFLLGEKWGISEWIGAALVLCGSLTVQLLGSTSQISEMGEESDNPNYLSSQDKQNDLSLSTVVIKPSKDSTEVFRK